MKQRKAFFLLFFRARKVPSEKKKIYVRNKCVNMRDTTRLYSLHRRRRRDMLQFLRILCSSLRFANKARNRSPIKGTKRNVFQWQLQVPRIHFAPPFAICLFVIKNLTFITETILAFWFSIKSQAKGIAKKRNILRHKARKEKIVEITSINCNGLR